MRSLRLVLLPLLFTLLGAVKASAQDVTLLTEPYAKKLNEKAVVVYNQGVRAYDFVNYDAALDNFYQAMQLDPKHIKLRLLVSRFALQRGRLKHGEEALRLFNIAREASSGLLAMPELKEDDKRRAQTDFNDAKALATDLPKRDTLREATGKQIIEEVAKEREQFAKEGLQPLGISESSNSSGSGTGSTATEVGRATRTGAGSGAAGRNNTSMGSRTGRER